MCGIWCKKKKDTLNKSSLWCVYIRAAQAVEAARIEMKRWNETFIDLFIQRWQLKRFTIFHHFILQIKKKKEMSSREDEDNFS